MFSKIFFCLALVALVFGQEIQTRNDVIVIDPFNPNSDVIVIVISSSTTFPVIDSTYTQSTEILGGERDLTLQVNAGLVGRVISTGVSNGTWDVSSPSEATSIATMQYDGVDGSSHLNVRGLGGVDLSTLGANAFRLNIVTDIETTYTINVFSLNGGQSTYDLVVPSSPNTKTFFADYNLFTGNAEFTSVGALEVVVAGGVNVDTNIDLFTTSSSSNPTSLSATPRPVSPSATPHAVPFTWYNVDDDFGREPCEDEPIPRPYFVSEQNIIYYYFYRAYYEPLIYYNAAADLAPYLFGTVAALILTVF